MLKDVNEYIKLCDVCMKNKGNQIPMPVQPMSVPNGPFEHVCVDIIGPLPVTDRGYMYMLIAVDRFSRYADGWPMQDQQTKTVTLTFINGWVCKHGIPLIVGSDRGSPFMSHLASDLYKELGIKKVKTTAYHPQSNGIVERFNKTLKYAMKVWCNENQNDWDITSPHAFFSYNTLYHSLIQETHSLLLMAEMQYFMLIL
jgi:transposase InsO family protein